MNDFRKSAMLVASLHKGEVTFEEITAKIRQGKIAASAVLSDQLWVAHTLMETQESPVAEKWHALRKEVQFKQLGVTLENVQSTTKQFGPRYNKLDSGGFLIPYSLDPTSFPASGFGYFKGLKALASGDVEFSFNSRPSKPPLIFGQDIEIALVIAFHSSAPKIPALSIEAMDVDGPESPRWIVRQKVWDPDWIGHTMLGETLYAADYWLGQITGYTSKHFPTSDSDIPDLDKRLKARTLLKEFELCGGHGDGNWNRVMLRPGNTYGTWQRHDSGDIVCNIDRVEVGVDGANVKIKIDPETNRIEEDRSLNLNNHHFAAGRAANLFTQNYDDIADMFPIFERGRQLVGLVKALIALRDDHGFRPNASLVTKINNVYQAHTTKPPLLLQQRLCLPLTP